MSRLLVFNPEHDFALAHANRFYVAPASIRKLGEDFDLLPLLWAKKHDYILRADDSVLDIANKKTMTCNPDILDCISVIEPWGWDPAIASRMLSLGFNDSLIPSIKEIEDIKRLSHRNITIKLNKFLCNEWVPQEFFSLEEAFRFAMDYPGCYFKKPWSGGGRGVLSTKELSAVQIKEWLHGCFKKQGSVLAEKGIDRKIDFASLWDTTLGDIKFLGYSVSLSDGRGKYKGNIAASQKELYDYIKNVTSEFDKNIIERQREFISSNIVTRYQGKLGIDMICDKSGRIFPCTEINLRRTMGHVAMEYYEASEDVKSMVSHLKLPFMSISSF